MTGYGAVVGEVAAFGGDELDGRLRADAVEVVGVGVEVGEGDIVFGGFASAVMARALACR